MSTRRCTVTVDGDRLLPGFVYLDVAEEEACRRERLAEERRHAPPPAPAPWPERLRRFRRKYGRAPR